MSGEISEGIIILVILWPYPSNCMKTGYNESTAGADASVDMPKLHNIKLLIAFIHELCDKQFNFGACKNSQSW